jgi:hypothetical protein
MTTILFFDDQHLSFISNVTRKIGRPKLIEKSLYVDPYSDVVNLAWGYPFVFKSEDTGKFLMLYQGWTVDRKLMPYVIPLVAESEDGFSWRPLPTTDYSEIADCMLPHQTLPTHIGDGVYGGSQCFIDEKASSAERYKCIAIYRFSNFEYKSFIFTSSNGIKWVLKEDSDWHKGNDAPDYPASVFWNDVRKSYVISARPRHVDRRISVKETVDWKNYSSEEVCIQSDALDPFLTEMYGMNVVKYEDYYIGFLLPYHTDPNHPIDGKVLGNLNSHKFWNGHVNCELAYSKNGWHFQRHLREPFIPNGGPDSPDSGCVYPTCMIDDENSNILIYSSMCSKEHGHIPAGSGCIGAYAMRKDGFTYFENLSGKGMLSTRCLYLNAGGISFNVQNPDGNIVVQLTDSTGKVFEGFSFDECVPFSGDTHEYIPRWVSANSMESLQGKVIRIEIKMQATRLYAIRGDFISLLPTEAYKAENFGYVPKEIPGL